MSAVVLFVLFFVILLFGLPISVTMGISSILPWVVDNTFAANLVMVLRQMMSGVNSLTLLGHPHVYAVRHHYGPGWHLQKAL